MARLITACILGIVMTAAAAGAAMGQEAQLEALSKLLPKAMAEWSTTGPKSKVVAEGPSKGVIAFQVYQNGPRTVIVRFTENPPELIKRILAEPGTYGYRRDEIDGTEVVLKSEPSAGTVLSKRKRILVSVDWSGAAQKEDAIAFFKAIDFDGLDKLN